MKDRGCEDSDAVWSVTKLQKSSNELSKLSLRTIHFKRADRRMLEHKWKQKGDKLAKEREMLPCEPTQPFWRLFWTSGWRSPVDTGVWRIRLFQSASLSHSRVWSQCGTLLFPKHLLNLSLQQHCVLLSIHSSPGALIEWFNHQISGSFSAGEVSSGTRSSITQLLSII